MGMGIYFSWMLTRRRGVLKTILAVEDEVFFLPFILPDISGRIWNIHISDILYVLSMPFSYLTRKE